MLWLWTCDARTSLFIIIKVPGGKWAAINSPVISVSGYQRTSYFHPRKGPGVNREPSSARKIISNCRIPNKSWWHRKNIKHTTGKGSMASSYLIGLHCLMEHTSINSSSNQVIGCGDRMDVSSEMQIKLQGKRGEGAHIPTIIYYIFWSSLSPKICWREIY